MNLTEPGLSKYRQYFARYLCAQWNQLSSDAGKPHLREVELIFMLEKVLPNYTKEPPVKHTLLRYLCDSEEVISTDEIKDL